jgi:outer membrane protein assembly factor BamB
VAEGKVLIGSYDGHLYALDAKTGEMEWRYETMGPVHAAPGVTNGITHVAGCDEHFRAIRIADGAELFEMDSGAYTGASPALVDGKAYFGTFSNEVLAIDLETREIIWRYDPPTGDFPFYSSAAMDGDRLYVGGRDKLIHALDARTGEPLWTFATQSRVESSPAVASGRVFVGSNDGRFYVLDADTGEKVWEFYAGEAITASPAISDGRIVVASLDGMVYCFGG